MPDRNPTAGTEKDLGSNKIQKFASAMRFNILTDSPMFATFLRQCSRLFFIKLGTEKA